MVEQRRRALAWLPHVVWFVPAQAYKAKALEHHPDKGGDEAMFLAVQAAYKALSAPNTHASLEASDPEGACASSECASSPQSLQLRARSGPVPVLCCVVCPCCVSMWAVDLLPDGRWASRRCARGPGGV